MVEYATRDQLRRWGTEILAGARPNLLKEAQERSPAGATFLSHSSKDVEYVAGAIRILNNHGASVYIDKKDDALPPFTSRETARILRDRINECRKFVLLATVASKDSKWMPWELGISDGYKKPRNVAIFPAAETATDTQWAEREYLGIYDRIVWGELEGHTDSVWMVLDQEKFQAVELSNWIARY